MHKADTCSTVLKILTDYYPAWYKKSLTVRGITNSTTRQQNCMSQRPEHTPVLEEWMQRDQKCGATFPLMLQALLSCLFLKVDMQAIF